MSLGDYLRLLRARHGGVTPLEIEAAAGLSRGIYRQMEQRYRAIGSDTTIERLADYFNTPVEELRWRTEWPRKELSRVLAHGRRSSDPITAQLWSGDEVTGKVTWWDLGAFALETEDGELVVQRHAVERWSPRAPIAANGHGASEDVDDDDDDSDVDDLD